MDSISLKNFRCFRDEQHARLAPLTLLVGENSTGKTSFMAMVRALWDVAYDHQVPDFKADPYDLGSFDDIAHHRGRRGGRAETFEASFTSMLRRPALNANNVRPAGHSRFTVAFGRTGTVPVPVRRQIEHDDLWIEERLIRDRDQELRIGTSKGSWKLSSSIRPIPVDLNQYTVRPLNIFIRGNRATQVSMTKPHLFL